MDEWQSIETAPKDGTVFQAWLGHWEPQCRFNPDSEAFEIWGRVDYDQDDWADCLAPDAHPLATAPRTSPRPLPPQRQRGGTVLKILFLDIDGVVLSGEDLWRTGNNRYLPPEKIALVNEVCERAGACVVVSSTWRRFDECADLLRFAGLRNMHADWRTSLEGREGILFRGEVRGDQIKRWLDEHPETCAYAIVDDDSDMLPEQMPRFVQTPFVTGIDRGHVEALIEALSIPLSAALTPRATQGETRDD